MSRLGNHHTKPDPFHHHESPMTMAAPASPSNPRRPRNNHPPKPTLAVSQDTTSSPTAWWWWRRKGLLEAPISPIPSSRTTATTMTSPIRARSASDQSTATPTLNSPPRTRLNSRDIPRTYSGLYGLDGDWMPFELNRRPSRKFSGSVFWIWLALYGTFLAVLLPVVCMVQSVLFPQIPLSWSWTAVNLVHAIVTIVQVHWIKGSMYFWDDVAGECNALTLWEQLEATPDTRGVRELLMVVPCLLTWMACHAVDYAGTMCLVNGLVWMACLLGKLPCMNGVRLFGINQTAGIDDDGQPQPEATAAQQPPHDITNNNKNNKHKNQPSQQQQQRRTHTRSSKVQ